MPLLPTVPPNQPALISVDRSHHTVSIDYNGQRFYSAKYSDVSRVEVVPSSDPERIEQSIIFHGTDASVDGIVETASQGFAAETRGVWQERFPLVRNSDGPSHNLRNNAVYDRGQDAVLVGPADGSTVIEYQGLDRFRLRATGNDIKLIFRPRYYQKHKNIASFAPWERAVSERPIMGWCSWWAYRDGIDEKTMLDAAGVFSRKLKPFGYDVIQLDDGYESASGAPPDFWLKTNKKFPHGLEGLARAIRKKGMEPGIWVGTQIFDLPITKEHPDWFARDPDGVAHKGPWIGYGVDGSKKAALHHLYQPVWEEFRKADFSYVKIDSLRHLLYDALYPCRPQMLAEGVTPEAAFRDYLRFAREQLGEQTYILACWGVLPEAAGIADACRLGGDGFGPSTMMQYNSWNNVVWRNDPDHVDLQGDGEEIIRPTLVSMAGAQLLLSDKVDFYENEANLEGAKRASPIPLTKPGQLYDYDPSKTDNLVKGLRNKNGGSDAGPLDASQSGEECPWWQLDVSRPFENWTVLARLSWKPQPAQTVSFADLGLEAGTYSVYEFWSKRYLGTFESGFTAEAQAAKAAHVYCIRRVVNHPQVVSTSRHITQGGPDLQASQWVRRSKRLQGESKVVGRDPYEVRIRCAGRVPSKSNRQFSVKGDLVTLRWTSKTSETSDWWVQFK